MLTSIVIMCEPENTASYAREYIQIVNDFVLDKNVSTAITPNRLYAVHKMQHCDFLNGCYTKCDTLCGTNNQTIWHINNL